MSQENVLVEGQLPTFQQFFFGGGGVPYDEQVNLCRGPGLGGVPIAYVSEEGQGDRGSIGSPSEQVATGLQWSYEDDPVNRLTDGQTGLKTLPRRNFICGLYKFTYFF